MRKYIAGEVKIDGRNIPYSIVTAEDYLLAKDILDGDTENYEKLLEQWEEENIEIYERITQILALKQSCYLMRRVSHSCGTLSDGLYYLKNRLIMELKNDYNFEFDDEFVENYKYPYIN